MTDETIRTIFTCCATLGAVVITQLFTYLNSKGDKTDSIYKQQYDKIFSPIHRTLFFTPSQRVTDDLEIISNIIYNNYSLASDALIEEFGKCFDNDEITKEFEHIIQSGYILLRNKLGYSKLKLKKSDERNATNSIISSRNKLKTLLYYQFLFLIASLIFYLLCKTVFFQ